MRRLFISVSLLLALIGCAVQPVNPPSNTPIPSSTPQFGFSNTPCYPTDQDRYVWRSARLRVLNPCVRAVGTVMELSEAEADGDTHIHIKLDAPYDSLLTDANQYVEGYLVVEAVCQSVPPLIEALRVCASDTDPYSEPLPHIGDHIWVEGRYVLDLGHHGFAELHPLYRWGEVVP